MNSTITVEFTAIGLAGSGSGFTCCELGFENNPKKLQKGGFPHMQKKGCTCIPSGTSPHACADAGSFWEFRIERIEILEPMTLVSPVGMGRSLMQAHRSDWVKVPLSTCTQPEPGCSHVLRLQCVSLHDAAPRAGRSWLGNLHGPARLEELMPEAGFTGLRLWNSKA